MRVNMDVTSMNTLNNLYKMDRSIGTILSRLSTGLRINGGVDDPSGNGIRTMFTRDESAADSAKGNLADGITRLQVINNQLDNIEDMVVRILDAAVMASDPNRCCQERQILNDEANELRSEIKRLAEGAKFNDKNILNGNIVDDIRADMGTAAIVGANSYNPSWSALDTVVYSTTVGLSSTRQSNNPGDTTDRVMSRQIDLNTNAPIGAQNQLTSDPRVWADDDNDGYYDKAAGGWNDPIDVTNIPPNDPSFPDNTVGGGDPDADGDGWHALVDDDDSDASETGTGLNTLAADYNFALGAPAGTRDVGEITIDNARYRDFNATVVDQVDVRVANGMNYVVEVFDTSGPGWTQVGGPQLGTGGWQTINFADVTADKVKVILDEPVNDIAGNADIGPGVISNDITFGAPVPQGGDVYRYFLNGGAQDMNEIDITVTGGVEYEIFDDSAASLTGVVTGTGGNQNYGAFGQVNTAYVDVAFQYGPLPYGSSADVLALSARNDEPLIGGATLLIDDFGAVNNNVATYNLNNAAPTNDDDGFDRITYTVANGHDFSIYRFNGAWDPVAVVSGTGTGAAQTFDVAADADEIDATQLRIVLHSGEDYVGYASIDSVTNRIDRDGDTFPDVIEAKYGSDRDNAGSLPFAATGGPDDDNDTYLDYNLYYDGFDEDFLAGTNPYGYNWVAGSGIALDTGSQYGPLDVVNAASIPSTVDTDGDNYCDPLDPYPNIADWTRWLDGDAAYKGGDVIFVSNRETPDNLAQRDLYMLSGGVYSRITTTGNVSSPEYSSDGTQIAWEQGGDIWGSVPSYSCSGTTMVTQMLVANGDNPTWSPDATELIFERGGNLIRLEVESGAETNLGISGADPSWGPDGELIAYSRGGQIYAYDLSDNREFSLGIAGTNPSWSPDGTKMAFETGGDVQVVSLILEQDPEYIFGGTYDNDDLKIEYDLPDARPFTLGINVVNLLTESSATNTITMAQTAIETLQRYRREMTTAMEVAQTEMNDRVQMEWAALQSRSRLENADMPQEIHNLVAEMVSQQAAIGSLSHWVNFENVRTLIGSFENN